MKSIVFCCCMALASVVGAETIVDVSGVGATKFGVAIQVGHPMFARCLQRNLELSGLFVVGKSGTIRVFGAPGAIRAEGRGKAGVAGTWVDCDGVGVGRGWDGSEEADAREALENISKIYRQLREDR